jgi:DDE superfamily endonuclease
LPIKLFVEDESRFGLMTVLRRRITLKGVKPKAPYQHDFSNTYLYGAVAPLTGESFFLEFPILNTQCFQIFIDQFSEEFSDSLNIIILDNGPFHITPKLRLPANVRLIFTPPYTPEVNPMERVWLDFKAQIAGETFDTIDALFDRLSEIIRACLPSQLSSLTSYPFFKAVCNVML